MQSVAKVKLPYMPNMIFKLTLSLSTPACQDNHGFLPGISTTNQVDKDIMCPRYPMTKRICNISGQEGSSLQRKDMANLADTLATVTLLPSDPLQVS